MHADTCISCAVALLTPIFGGGFALGAALVEQDGELTLLGSQVVDGRLQGADLLVLDGGFFGGFFVARHQLEAADFAAFAVCVVGFGVNVLGVSAAQGGFVSGAPLGEDQEFGV